MTMEYGMATGARTMKDSEFKAKCLKLMDEVAESGQGHHHYQERPTSLQAHAPPKAA